MRKAVVSSIAILALSTPAWAARDPHERLIACYEEKMMPATYEVEKRLISPPIRKYVRRNGRIELVEDPAIYRELRHEIEPAYKLLVEIPCD
ncbi:hypothetical protein [Pseudoprimorskyibacter insulae]|uniref:Uncharacterized protein n=1 Tax=Pseudoprimorskyibacter insulae TaxID=1695997 RepID=A0A2R8AZQ1_9RHOB|nr:hypothetical protein [Pseudoprimorskyibacter insulae]SPF81334.1 hypothetical protein PRI8871_03157 [Pseudoprimorskyibacter insulae]